MTKTLEQDLLRTIFSKIREFKDIKYDILTG